MLPQRACGWMSLNSEAVGVLFTCGWGEKSRSLFGLVRRSLSYGISYYAYNLSVTAKDGPSQREIQPREMQLFSVNFLGRFCVTLQIPESKRIQPSFSADKHQYRRGHIFYLDTESIPRGFPLTFADFLRDSCSSYSRVTIQEVA